MRSEAGQVFVVVREVPRPERHTEKSVNFFSGDGFTRACCNSKMRFLIPTLIGLALVAGNSWARDMPPSRSVKKQPGAKARAAADSFESRSIGHLVSSNNALLKPGEMAFGTLYTGIGITPNWSLGTSPFGMLSFKMSNVMSRWARNISATERLGFELDYFKSYGEISDRDRKWKNYCDEFLDPECSKGQYPYGFSSFKMEAWAAKFTYSRAQTSAYRFSATGSFYYYIDDERPFSLRMDPQNSDAFAANLTTLHEFKLQEGVFLALELGAWGLNYVYPYIHSGATIEFQSLRKNVFLGFGATSTFSPSFPASKAKNFAGYDSRASYHPEIQVEIFF